MPGPPTESVSSHLISSTFFVLPPSSQELPLAPQLSQLCHGPAASRRSRDFAFSQEHYVLLNQRTRALRLDTLTLTFTNCQTKDSGHISVSLEGSRGLDTNRSGEATVRRDTSGPCNETHESLADSTLQHSHGILRRTGQSGQEKGWDCSFFRTGSYRIVSRKESRRDTVVRRTVRRWWYEFVFFFATGTPFYLCALEPSGSRRNCNGLGARCSAVALLSLGSGHQDCLRCGETGTHR